MMKMDELKKEYNDVEKAKAKLRSVQSTKCRLQKQKEMPNYDSEMTKTLNLEQGLKELVKFYSEPKLFVTNMTKSQIEQLTYDEVVKALKSIQSKKSIEKYNEDKTELNKAIEIEEMLKSHRDNIKPLDETVVSKKSISALIELIKIQDKSIVTKDFILAKLQELV